MKIIRWVPSCSTQVDARTSRHDEANSRFSQFCKSIDEYNSVSGKNLYIYIYITKIKYFKMLTLIKRLISWCITLLESSIIAGLFSESTFHCALIFRIFTETRNGSPFKLVEYPFTTEGNFFLLFLAPSYHLLLWFSHCLLHCDFLPTISFHYSVSRMLYVTYVWRQQKSIPSR
jgi:hypothetical protein